MEFGQVEVVAAEARPFAVEAAAAVPVEVRVALAVEAAAAGDILAAAGGAEGRVEVFRPVMC